MTQDGSPRGVALVTGGARGIGLGISRSLAAEGYDLALCGTRPREGVADTLDQLRVGCEDRDLVYVRGDISEASQRQGILDQVRDHFGRLNVLVNNAGVSVRDRVDLLDATEESYERVMRINLQGPYFLTQEVARFMVEQQKRDPGFHAAIVNITSISSTVASTNRGEYCLSKAALSMATKLWAMRLAEHGIPVYEVQPGIIATDMTKGVKGKYDQMIEDGLLLEPRWGQPEDIGRIVSMLVRGDLPYATGQVLVVDGGMTLPRL